MPETIGDRLSAVRDVNLTQFTYNVLGKVLTATDPLGHVTTNTYNAAGNLLTTEDPLHNVTTNFYSVVDGQLLSMTDASESMSVLHYLPQ